jgi:large subunit ribosomal protein L7/L12
MKMAEKKESKAGKKVKKEATPATDPVQLVIETVRKMNVLQVSQLVKALEAEFGVTAAAPMMAAPAVAAPAAPAAAPAEEEKTEFDVLLKEVGAQKIQVIKVVRELTSLGLRESKELVEGAPQPVLQKATKEAAQTAKAKLEEVGAKAEIV